MEYRYLGGSGFRVPALSFGTATFGGVGEYFGAWGRTDVAEANRIVDRCIDAGVNMFDTANIYSAGLSEEILGKAIAKRRSDIIISTKASFRVGSRPNDVGSSRAHLIDACEASLRRLGTDYIDLFQLHGFDAMTPVEETLSVLDDLVRAGKIRYVGCSNFSGWHLMKSLAIAKQYSLPRYIAHQLHYSLVTREYEWELMPLALDQNVGAIVWSPLGGARLTGVISRRTPPKEGSRRDVRQQDGPFVDQDYLYDVVDALQDVAAETGKSVAQVALNWLLKRPTISSLIIGARNETQLLENLGAIGWNLEPHQIARLDSVSYRKPVYPYWHQQQTLKERNPLPVDDASLLAGAGRITLT